MVRKGNTAHLLLTVLHSSASRSAAPGVFCAASFLLPASCQTFCFHGKPRGRPRATHFVGPSVHVRALTTASAKGNLSDESSVLLPKVVVQKTLHDEILPAIQWPCTGGENDSKLTVLLGVSGGCDSVALLHILCEVLAVTPQAAKNLHVVHFDHQQRGIDSDGDRKFVQALCKELNVPFHCYYWNTTSDHDCDTRNGPLFSQDKARQWRRTTMRQLLGQLLRKETTQDNGSHSKVTGLLVTAHHKDDADETLLLKLLRGAHLTNLVGLPVVTPDEGGAENQNTGGGFSMYWARPLIHLRKVEIRAYLQSRNCAWREDASNQSGKYLRNRVRNELVPLIEELVGGQDSFRRRLDNVQEQSRELRNDLDARALKYLESNVEQDMFILPTATNGGGGTARLFDLAAREALYRWVVQQSGGHQFTYEHLQRVCKQIDVSDNLQWQLNIGDGWDIQRHGNALRLVRDGDTVASIVPEVELECRPVRDLTQEERSSHVVVCLSSTSNIEPRFFRSSIQTKKLYITPPWRRDKSPILVSEFLRGQKVPLHLRKLAPVITTNNAPSSLVAVYVVTRNKWIVDSAFAGDDTSHEKLRAILP